jgi:hypothetical protein
MIEATFGERPQASDDAANTAVPIEKVRRRPIRSERDPPTRTSADRKSA